MDLMCRVLSVRKPSFIRASMYIVIISLHLLSSNHKSTHPCCNTAQKLEMRWTSSMKNACRGMCCPQSIVCGVGVFRYYSMREST
jgi:hypothetical protein